MSEKIKKKNETKFKGVNTYVLLFTLLIIVALLTYIIPAGKFELFKDPNTGRMLTDPQSYHRVDKNPASFFDMFRAIQRGMVAGANIIFFIFIISGSVQIINATGAINAGILKLTEKFKGREKYLIPIFMVVFSFTGAFLGFSEENLVFIPLAVSLSRYLGYDGIVGICISYLATQVGFLSGLMNPFNVGVAHGIAELPMFSGIGFRILIYIVYMLVTAWYVMRYAEKVKKNPESSLVSNIVFDNEKFVDLSNVEAELTTRHKIIYFGFIIAVFAILYGAFNYGWYVADISAVFLILGIGAGLICRFSFTKIADEFIAGAKGIVFGALIVGFARAIYIIMEESFIMDSIINFLVGGIGIFPGATAIVGIFIIQWFINILVPSATGQAAISMPIFVPVADMLNITRQTSVIAFQLGDGINNSIIPTSSTLLAACTMADVPYHIWVKFLWRLTLIWSVIGAGLCILANVINLGPF